MKKQNILLILLGLLLFFVTNLPAQEVFKLYPDEIPNSKIVIEVDSAELNPSGMLRKSTIPTLQVFLPEKENATGTAVVICPGGGYAVVVYDGEGVSTAKAFAAKGIAAFVLKYRLPLESTMDDKKLGPLQDAQQAIKVVRENAEKWDVDANKIGIMGFSAGGHLAATEATHYSKALIQNDNGTSLRPDFQILVYPVISMQDNLTHLDSRKSLLGENPSQEIIDDYSNELQVDENTPPAYLTHAGDDGLVDVDNSIEYFEALRHKKVMAELHVYQKGNHGFVFKHPGWMEPLFSWMEELNLLQTP
ncbi:MAG: alpha/beta hydrolase [Prolixibacteraceae bacterium]